MSALPVLKYKFLKDVAFPPLVTFLPPRSIESASQNGPSLPAHRMERFLMAVKRDSL